MEKKIFETNSIALVEEVYSTTDGAYQQQKHSYSINYENNATLRIHATTTLKCLH